MCLENDYQQNIGSLTVLYHLIKYLNTPRIKLCFNTANAYSLGFDLSRNKIDKILEITEVIKLTPISKSIKRGSKKKPIEMNIEDSKYYKKLNYIRTSTNKPIII